MLLRLTQPNRVRLKLNGNYLNPAFPVNGMIRDTLMGTDFLSTDNKIELAALETCLDWIEVVYSRHLAAFGRQLAFCYDTTGAASYAVSGFGNDSVWIMDVSAPQEVLLLKQPAGQAYRQGLSLHSLQVSSRIRMWTSLSMSNLLTASLSSIFMRITQTF